MNNIIVKKGNKTYSLNIDKIKYCIGFNYLEKFHFKQIIIESLNNIKESEYSINNSGQAKIFINEKELDCKKVQFVSLSENYSIVDDLKLSTKSLIAKYLEALMSQVEYVDTINSINILLESFGNELDNDLIESRFITYTPKLFLKILLPIFIKNSECANEYDLDYNECILFQLKMIDYISRNNHLNTYICLLDIPLLTREIKEYLDKMNCIVIVLLDKYNVVPDIKDIYLFDRIVIDLSEEEAIYNLCVCKGICTIEEAKEEMKRILLLEKEKLDMSIFEII